MIKNILINFVLLIGLINGDETKENLSTENYTSVIVGNHSGAIVQNNLNQKINVGRKEQHSEGVAQFTMDLFPGEHPYNNQSTTAPPDTESPSADGYQFMYFITPVSLAILGVILWRTMRLKKTRAEIKYGNAEKTELKPLPLTLEDSSDDENEETNQTLFDINQLKNSRENFA